MYHTFRGELEQATDAFFNNIEGVGFTGYFCKH